MEQCTLSAKRINLMVLMILIFNPLIGMGVDLIAPSLPAISRSLEVSTVLSKNLIAIYLLGYALGNFLGGVLSEAWGRKKLLTMSLFAFALVSLLPALIANAHVLLAVRLLQGLGLGAYAAIGRATLSDILPVERLMRTAPLLAMTWGIGPIIGPVIGAYLQVYFDWQACFYFFAAVGALALLLIGVSVPETHFKRQALNIGQIGRNFKEILGHKVFVGSILIMGCSYSLLIVFNTLGPFLIQETLNYSPVFFGHVALVMGLVFLMGTILCRRLIKKFSPERIFQFTVPTCLGVTILAVILAYFFGQNIGVIVISSLLMFFSTGILYPTGMGKGLALFRHLAGSASALMNLINVLIVSLASAAMSLVSAESMFPLACMYFLLIALAGACYWFLIHPKKAIMS